ncbi:MAG: hypothetical protein ABJO27_20575 [Pseudoruegeria sp.]
MSNNIAVLTGDLIGSTRKPPATVDAAMSVLAKASDTLSEWQEASVHFTRARGDGWQLALTSPVLGLRSCLFLRASLRAANLDLNTRISVGVGLGSLSTSGDLNGASGDAFVLSGHGLDRLTKKQSFSFNNSEENSPLQAIFILADALSDGWTVAQAASMAGALSPHAPTQSELAKTLGHSRQAIQKSLSSAQFEALRQAIDVYEAGLTTSA